MQKQASLNKKVNSQFPVKITKRICEGMFIIILSVALFLILALASYDQHDPAWSFSGSHEILTNRGGQTGAWFADVFLYIFGYLAYLIPLALIYSGSLILQGRKEVTVDIKLLLARAFGFMLIVGSSCALVDLEFAALGVHLPYTTGGVVGNYIANLLSFSFNRVGAQLFSISLLLTGITLLTGLSWMLILAFISRWLMRLLAYGYGVSQQGCQSLMELLVRLYKNLHKKLIQKPRFLTKKSTGLIIKKDQAKRLDPNPASIKQGEMPAKKPKTLFPVFETQANETIPPLSLLEPAKKNEGQGYTHTELEAIAREIERQLLDFGVKAQVVAIHPGPVITRFELQLAPGTKASKLTNLAKDLARSLSITTVRVVEVVPGKPVVGLELPNKYREIVRLSEVLESKQYKQAHSPLSLALGVDIAGNPVIVDLAKMPHLLVAGTTGSGKSVGLNVMLLSLLFKCTPREVRLILVDPKMLELSVYEGIPHLLTPVVTDMKEAANGLRWSVAEMERRYRLMAALRVRNILGYNNKIKQAAKQNNPIKDPLWPHKDESQPAPNLQTLPYIVVVIDELADMMMVVGKKVEQLIARLSQKARASGIHLILATQRPSVDVLTGLIKSNVPTRIAFQVSSKIDSRTILDQMGAEQLLGYGDMLYLAPGAGTPVRVHGAFVDDQEVHQVTEDWKRRGKPVYVTEVLDETQDKFSSSSSGESPIDIEEADPLYDEAVAFVIHARKASISSVQRRLKIGYNRAARLIEEMERIGIVSAMASNGSREILVGETSQN